MENIPPSYESATARDPWQMVAPYVPSGDLCALSRVSQRLYKVFAPCLWGNPASHFGTENDRVYVALTRFKRILKRVRLKVRELTHTLHLPPAQSEIYDGPRPEWLRDVLEQLPNLQSLVVSRLPFFDHMALLALKTHSQSQLASVERAGSTFSLRLLIAARCQNTTSQGLAEALEHFPNLAFLDLSYTLAARDSTVLSRLRDLSLLQVLKLGSIHLRDDDMQVVAEAIGIRVRSLDVRGNHLTDHSVRTLLSTCFQIEEATNGSSISRAHTPSSLAVEDWPSGFARPNPAVLDEFKDQKYDERMIRRLTSGTISRLPYEDLPSSGITHLYVANNNLTMEGLASLVRSKKLHVLDAGSLNHGSVLNRPGAASSTSTPHPHDDNRSVMVPGIEKLTPILAEFGGDLTFLRLHHAILTEHAPTKIDERPNTCELSAVGPFKQELEGSQPTAALELDATPPLYELEPHGQTPRFELAGDSTHLVVSPPIGTKPALTPEESQPVAKRDGVFAPEVVEKDESEDEEPSVFTAAGFLGTSAQTVNGVTRHNSAMIIEGDIASSSVSQGTLDMQLAIIEKQRQELRLSRLDEPHGLIPGMMPKLRTLTLTDVPTHTQSTRVHQALIQFIKDCASEAELATLQSQLGPSSVHQSGERRSKHHSHGAREIFALKQVILEMAPAASSISAQSARTSGFTRNTKSSTEDPDSEALWAAAENDFTFFDDDEECGLPAVETNPYVHCSALSDKMVMPSNSCQAARLSMLQRPSQKEPTIDVIQEVAHFRKERKSAYESATKRGVQHVEGYWPGHITIVRGHHADGTFDYYGNLCGKTGVYR